MTTHIIAPSHTNALVNPPNAFSHGRPDSGDEAFIMRSGRPAKAPSTHIPVRVCAREMIILLLPPEKIFRAASAGLPPRSTSSRDSVSLEITAASFASFLARKRFNRVKNIQPQPGFWRHPSGGGLMPDRRKPPCHVIGASLTSFSQSSGTSPPKSGWTRSGDSQ